MQKRTHLSKELDKLVSFLQGEVFLLTKAIRKLEETVKMRNKREGKKKETRERRKKRKMQKLS